MKKMTKQRLLGLTLVALSALLIALASQGKTVEDRDVTAVILLLPLGIYALVTKEYIFYDGDAEAGEEPEQKARAKRPGRRRGTYTNTRARRHAAHDETKGVTSWQESAL